VAILKQEIKGMKMTAKQFPPSMKKGRQCGVPDEINGGLPEPIDASKAKFKEDMVSIGRQTKNSRQQSQEPEAQVVMADVRKVVRQLRARLQAIVQGNGCRMFAAAETRGANGQLGAEVGGLKLRVEVLETRGVNPHSGLYHNWDRTAAMNAADLEADSYFTSAWRNKEKNIPHTRSNWVCYDFKERRIVQHTTQSARSHGARAIVI
jgi:hypothetical protein